MYKTLFSLFMLVIISLPGSLSAFSRNLTVGSFGDDVLELQQLLNSDSDTRLAITGPGSPGSETRYFGSITKNALIKFQNKFRSEILTPVGLSFGTGYFGPSTIKKVNQEDVRSVTKQPTITSSNISEDNNVQLSKKEDLYSSSPQLAKGGSRMMILRPGQLHILDNSITLFGEGFDLRPKVMIDDKVVVPSIKSDSELSFKIPTLSTKTPELWLETDNGMQSNHIPLFVGTQGLAKTPKINNVSSDIVSWNDTITIEGDNFTDNNTVVLPHVVLFGVPSDDGRTLVLFLEDHFNAPIKSNITIPFPLLILNNNGVSEYYNGVQLSI